MKDRKSFVHPYIPNSVPGVKEQMLKEIGVDSVDELYKEIPEDLRFKGKMNMPEPLTTEYELRRHMESVLAKNKTCKEYISFLGAGCYRHYIPAICDEVAGRSEFLTAYAGEPYEDHGRFMALFEYASMMGELLEMDVVNVPTYDWGQAASTSIRMSCRLTGRNKALVADSIHPDRLAIIRNYCRGVVEIETFGFDTETGKIDLAAIESRISDDIAAVYFENPSFLGILDDQGESVSEAAHKVGAISVVGVDPITLGVVTPPSQYGADIVCGDIQSLGIHVQYGGCLAGFIATHDDERFVMEYPSRIFGITKTSVEGEWGFGDVTYDRTSFAHREQGKEFIGTATALYGITAGVYLALAGPEGIQQVGTTVLQKTKYAQNLIGALENVSIPFEGSAHFREFVVDFSGTGKSVDEINSALEKEGIFGGSDISGKYPGLEQCALYCITEMHTQEEIEKLTQSLKNIISR